MITYEETHEGIVVRIDALFDWKNGRKVSAGYLLGIDEGSDGWLLSDVVVHDKAELGSACFGLFKKVTSFQGRGVGSELLRRFEVIARSSSATSIHGMIAGVNEAEALRLKRWYEGHGYLVSKSGNDESKWGAILKELR